LNQGSGAVPYSNTKFVLTAKISNAGVASSATLNLGGGTLLSSSSLMNFGFYAVPGGTMEFLFTNMSGSLVPGVYDPIKPLDVMLTGVGTAFTGAWTSSWSSTTNASAAIREDPPIEAPEPSVLLLTLVGVAALGVNRARRNHRA
jgi:hypothetical protein